MAKPKPIIYKNKTYTSLRKLAEDYNIHYATFKQRLKRNWSIEKALETPPTKQKPIIYKNKTYKTLKELTNEYNTNYNTVSKRLDQGWSLEKAIETPIKTNPGKSVTYNNKTYDSITKLAKTYNISAQALCNRLKKGIKVEKAIKELSQQIIRYNNKTYTTLKELANEYNIHPATLNRRLRQGLSIKKAIETPTKNKNKSVIYKNKIYKSITDLMKEYNPHNLSFKTVSTRIRNGITPEEAIETPIQGTKFKYLNIKCNNKNFKSLSDLAKKYNPHNIPYPTIVNRVRRGMTPEEAINAPRLNTGIKTFKQIKIAYTHNNIDYYECLHNNQKYILSMQEMKNFTEKNNACKTNNI